MPRPERERMILEASTREFGDKGYGQGSLTRVAAEVGVSKPLILSYFGSKDDLYLACLHRSGSALVAAVEVAQQGPADVSRAMGTLDALFHALEHRLEAWGLVYDWSVPESSPVHTVADTYRSRLNRMGSAGVHELISTRGSGAPLDADLLTYLWFGTVTAVIRWWSHHREQSADEMTARCRRVLTALAGPGQARSRPSSR